MMETVRWQWRRRERKKASAGGGGGGGGGGWRETRGKIKSDIRSPQHEQKGKQRLGTFLAPGPRHQTILAVACLLRRVKWCACPHAPTHTQRLDSPDPEQQFERCSPADCYWTSSRCQENASFSPSSHRSSTADSPDGRTTQETLDCGRARSLVQRCHCRSPCGARCD